MSDDLELRIVHERIAELEALLSGRPKRRFDGRRIGVPLVALAVAVGAAMLIPVRAKAIPVVYTRKLAPIVPAGALELADDAAPALGEVDGKAYAVVRGWRAGHEAAPLHVVAFDRSDWRVAWRSSAHAADEVDRGHLTVVGDKVVLVDPSKSAFVLDLRTGEEKKEAQLYTQGRRIWPLGNDDVMIGFTKFPSAHDNALVLNLTGFDLYPREADREPQCITDRTKTCLGASQPPPPAIAKLYPNADFTHEVRNGNDAFMMVSERAGVGPGVIEHAVLWDGAKAVWRGPLAPATRTWQPWPNTAPEGLLAFAHRRIYYLYPMLDGERRIRARDYATGKELYDTEIPGLRYGSKVASFTADGDEALIVANDSLFVLDGKTGAVKHRVNSF